MRPSVVSAVVGVAGIIAAVPAARADFYQVENLAAGSSHEQFNNSAGTETEDCWVANSFQVAAGGTHITSLDFLVGSALTNQQVTFTLYTGTSLTSPTGLSRIGASTNTTLVTSVTNVFATLTFPTAIDLPVGQVFYAAMLIRGVPGSLFPYSSDAQSAGPPVPLGRSFFDVGPTAGGAYDLDVTTNATILGGTHPVLGAGEQSPGNLALRVNAVPAPASLGLLALGGLIARRRRRA